MGGRCISLGLSRWTRPQRQMLFLFQIRQTTGCSAGETRRLLQMGRRPTSSSGSSTNNPPSSFGPGTSRSLGFTLPGALTIDSKGNLYVVDTANNRILRFPKPFAITTISSRRTWLSVSLTLLRMLRIMAEFPKDPLVNTNNAATSGLAFDGQGNLWLSDARTIASSLSPRGSGCRHKRTCR